jgi:hypothetical protein
MKQLGITYQHATPQSIGDQWWFWNCENIPATLPGYLEEADWDPHEMIGWGLSQEDADKITAYKPGPVEEHHGSFIINSDANGIRVWKNGKELPQVAYGGPPLTPEQYKQFREAVDRYFESNKDGQYE